MPHYITLFKWTDQGIRAVKETPRRAEDAKKLAEQLGGSMQIYYTMGEYDGVAIAEAKDDETALQMLLQIGQAGNVRTTTLKAYTLEEFTKAIAKVR